MFPGDWISSSVPMSKSIFVQFLGGVVSEMFDSSRLRVKGDNERYSAMCSGGWSTVVGEDLRKSKLNSIDIIHFRIRR